MTQLDRGKINRFMSMGKNYCWQKIATSWRGFFFFLLFFIGCVFPTMQTISLASNNNAVKIFSIEWFDASLHVSHSLLGRLTIGHMSVFEYEISWKKTIHMKMQITNVSKLKQCRPWAGVRDKVNLCKTFFHQQAVCKKKSYFFQFVKRVPIKLFITANFPASNSINR